MPLFNWTDEDVYLVAERAHNLYLEGRYKEAAVIFEGLVAIDPQGRYPGNGLAACYLALGEPERALEAANALLKRRPDDVDARARRCEALVELTRMDEARRELNEIGRWGASRHLPRLRLRLDAAGKKFSESL